MSQGIAIQVVGNDTGVQRMLEVLDTALNPVAIAAFLGTEVGPYLAKRASARFASEGDDAVGGKWAPLREATQAIRENLGYGASHPINRRTGELEEYITQTSGRTSIMGGVGASLVYPGKDPAGELADKVRVAQQGGKQEPTELSSGSYTVPRPVLGMDETDLVYVMTALSYHIQSVGKRML